VNEIDPVIEGESDADGDAESVGETDPVIDGEVE